MGQRQWQFELLSSCKQHFYFQEWPKTSHSTGSLPQVLQQVADWSYHRVINYFPWLRFLPD